MEYRSYEAFSPTDTDGVGPAAGDGAEGTENCEPENGRGLLSRARDALGQVRDTVHRVQTEVGRVVNRVRGRSSSAALRCEAGELIGRLENHVVRLRKNFQELERIHQVLHVGTAPLQEVQELQRRIAEVEKRLGAARGQATSTD
jgi:hypothetical protein